MNDTVLQWALSLISVAVLWLMGNGSKYGPLVGLLGQLLWIYYVWHTRQWGLMPGVVMFTVVHGRNYVHMRKVPHESG
jgi:hypothetical protein